MAGKVGWEERGRVLGLVEGDETEEGEVDTLHDCCVDFMVRVLGEERLKGNEEEYFDEI